MVVVVVSIELLVGYRQLTNVYEHAFQRKHLSAISQQDADTAHGSVASSFGATTFSAAWVR
eukprot:m.291584 g.291584  ORF g.291584 m.291584 type:complete len:61 (-) comp19979_c1_seq2:115-297(-)